MFINYNYILIRFKIFICKYEQLTPIFKKHSTGYEIRPFPPDSLASMTPPKLSTPHSPLGEPFAVPSYISATIHTSDAKQWASKNRGHKSLFYDRPNNRVIYPW